MAAFSRERSLYWFNHCQDRYQSLQQWGLSTFCFPPPVASGRAGVRLGKLKNFNEDLIYNTQLLIARCYKGIIHVLPPFLRYAWRNSDYSDSSTDSLERTEPQCCKCLEYLNMRLNFFLFIAFYFVQTGPNQGSGNKLWTRDWHVITFISWHAQQLLIGTFCIHGATLSFAGCHGSGHLAN